MADLRISDQERDRTAQELREHFAVGRLTETDSERLRHTQIYGEAAGVPARLLPDGAI